MQKKDSKSNKLKKKLIACIFLLAGIIIVIAMVASVYLGIRPWEVLSVDASTIEETLLDPDDLPKHIRVSHMDLVFTGMYTVDSEQKDILGYYYMGMIGDQTWIVEMPPSIVSEGLSEAMPDLEDQSFEGIPTTATDIIEKLSQAEGMDVDTYTDTYNISPVPLLAGTRTMEKQMIEYGIAAIMAFTCFLIGHLIAHDTGEYREDEDDETN